MGALYPIQLLQQSRASGIIFTNLIDQAVRCNPTPKFNHTPQIPTGFLVMFSSYIVFKVLYYSYRIHINQLAGIVFCQIFFIVFNRGKSRIQVLCGLFQCLSPENWIAYILL